LTSVAGQLRVGRQPVRDRDHQGVAGPVPRPRSSAVVVEQHPVAGPGTASVPGRPAPLPCPPFPQVHRPRKSSSTAPGIAAVPLTVPFRHVIIPALLQGGSWGDGSPQDRGLRGCPPDKHSWETIIWAIDRLPRTMSKRRRAAARALSSCLLSTTRYLTAERSGGPARPYREPTLFKRDVSSGTRRTPRSRRAAWRRAPTPFDASPGYPDQQQASQLPEAALGSGRGGVLGLAARVWRRPSSPDVPPPGAAEAACRGSMRTRKSNGRRRALAGAAGHRTARWAAASRRLRSRCGRRVRDPRPVQFSYRGHAAERPAAARAGRGRGEGPAGRRTTGPRSDGPIAGRTRRMAFAPRVPAAT